MLGSLLCMLLALPAAHAPADVSSLGSATMDARALVREGEALYRKGECAEALPKFEEARRAGAASGRLYYEMGRCYKMTRMNPARSRRYMRKAARLLEKRIEKGAAGVAPFYYLSAIYNDELGDTFRAKEIARKGLELFGKEKLKRIRDGGRLYEVARLLDLAGRPADAAGWYTKAATALAADENANREYLASALKQLPTREEDKQAQAKKAALAERLARLGPIEEKDRLRISSDLARSGDLELAIGVLEGFTGDELATEANYVRRVLQRYLTLGAPPRPPAWSKLDDAALEQAIRAAALELSAVRKKEEDPSKVPQCMISSPPSAERVAAEKKFFGLLMEHLVRGRPFRMMALSGGYARLIFR